MKGDLAALLMGLAAAGIFLGHLFSAKARRQKEKEALLKEFGSMEEKENTDE